MSNLEKYNLPIILATTGHRDIREEDKEILSIKVEEIFTELRKQFPNTKFILLSPLAEGSDRLVAKVAIENGIELQVPLPFEESEYCKDFETEISKKEFYDLLDKSYKKNTASTIGDSGNKINREDAYQWNNYYIATHSQILIALWDGIDNGKKGGTAELIEYKSKGVPVKFLNPKQLLNFEERGLVYIINTPRKCHIKEISDPFKITLLNTTNNDVFFQINRNFDKLNEEIKKIEPKIDQNMMVNNWLKSEKLNFHDPKLFEYFSISDYLAALYKKKYLSLIYYMFLLIPISIIFFEFYDEMISFYTDYFNFRITSINETSKYLEVVSLTGYVVILLFLIIFLYWGKKKEYHRKYLDYRALAEGIKMQTIWDIAGIQENVCDHYLVKQANELNWIRYAIRVISENTRLQKVSSNIEINRYDKIKINWINEQLDYFKNKINFNSVKLKRLNFFSKLLLSLCFVTVLSMFILSFSDLPYSDTKFPLTTIEHYRHIPIFLLTLFLSIIASIEGYSEKMLFSEQGNQYKKMYEIFYTANQRFEDYKDTDIEPHFFDLILFELGKEALNENADWVIMHRSRPIELKVN